MMPHATSRAKSSATQARLNERIIDLLSGKVLPVGLVCLLTGMIWAGERQVFHQLFYLLVALPSLLLSVVSPGLMQQLMRSPVFIAFACFATYFSISIAWTGSEDSVTSLLKRPVYVLLLFLGTLGVAFHHPKRLNQALKAAAILGALSAVILLTTYLYNGKAGRFAGYGALHNPLLTSHVFGFFIVLWIAYWIDQRRLFLPITWIAVAILGTMILATGSRTPLLALTTTVLWLGLLTGNRRGLIACGALILVGSALITIWPETVAQRGLSYRPQIWAETWRQAQEFPIFGHGYDHPLRIKLASVGYELWEAHNMTLSVLYQGGVVGLLLWAALYVVTLFQCWKQRANPLVFILSSTVVYGLAAGMTEGGSFLSRPKEHWFLIWIPITLTAAALLNARSDTQRRED